MRLGLAVRWLAPDAPFVRQSRSQCGARDDRLFPHEREDGEVDLLSALGSDEHDPDSGLQAIQFAPEIVAAHPGWRVRRNPQTRRSERCPRRVRARLAPSRLRAKSANGLCLQPWAAGQPHDTGHFQAEDILRPRAVAVRRPSAAGDLGGSRQRRVSRRGLRPAQAWAFPPGRA